MILDWKKAFLFQPSIWAWLRILKACSFVTQEILDLSISALFVGVILIYILFTGGSKNSVVI